MKNCAMKLCGNVLTITIDVSKDFGMDFSGKSIVVASTEGYIPLPKKDEMKIGLNVYKKT